MIKKFNINVRRAETIEVEVEAENYEEAVDKAMNVAHNTNFHDEADFDGYFVEDENGEWKSIG